MTNKSILHIMGMQPGDHVNLAVEYDGAHLTIRESIHCNNTVMGAMILLAIEKILDRYDDPHERRIIMQSIKNAVDTIGG